MPVDQHDIAFLSLEVLIPGAPIAEHLGAGRDTRKDPAEDAHAKRVLRVRGPGQKVAGDGGDT